LYAGRYGDLPDTLITTISGQKPLNPNLWGDYLPVIADIPLEPFSEAEARQFLASKNITDEATIEVILTLSGRLPLWLATLAEARPQDGADIGDPAGDAVGRFLKWEDDPGRRDIAVAAALPRVLNQDVLAAIAPADKVPDLFGWLRGLPFVSQRAGSWAYHEVVRAAMLRLRRAEAPMEWRSSQLALAQANARWAGEITAGADKPWANPDWVDCTREETYHLLCADPIGNLSKALSTAVKAAEHSTIRARQWAGLIGDAGRDTDNPVLRQWGQRLRDGIHDNDSTEYLTCLVNDAHLDSAALVIAFEERGYGHQLAGRGSQAIADFNRAIEIDPADAWAIAQRGRTYRLTGRFDEALTDFNRAIEIDPADAWAITSRGQTYREMERYDEALTDFNRAIDLNPEYTWAIAERDATYRATERRTMEPAPESKPLQGHEPMLLQLVRQCRDQCGRRRCRLVGHVSGTP
jgi:tetratricopeptide (TPR) repeat protein